MIISEVKDRYLAVKRKRKGGEEKDGDEEENEKGEEEVDGTKKKRDDNDDDDEEEEEQQEKQEQEEEQEERSGEIEYQYQTLRVVGGEVEDENKSEKSIQKLYRKALSHVDKQTQK